MARLATYKDAINEVFYKSIDEAFKKAGVPKRTTDMRTNGDNPELAREFKEVAVRYGEYFNPANIYILDLRNLSPLAAAFAEEEDAA
jgi:hypothetical protein